VFTFVVTRAGRIVLRGIATQKRKDSDLRTRQWLSETEAGVSEATDVSSTGMPEATVSYYMLIYI